MERFYNKSNALLFLSTLLLSISGYFFIKLINHSQYWAILNYLSVFLSVSYLVLRLIVGRAYIKNDE